MAPPVGLTDKDNAIDRETGGLVPARSVVLAVQQKWDKIQHFSAPKPVHSGTWH
jgi:hypothetical protein